MRITKMLAIVLGLSSVVTIVAFTSMVPQEEGFKNLKVLPKNIAPGKLDHLMDEWSASLGVRCNFCHVRDEVAKHMDFANDAKPEKGMAREMYKMMNKINKEYFEAKKDSLGMMMTTGVNCNSCHRGVAHPEVKLPEMHKGPGGPPPGLPGTGTPPGMITPPSGLGTPPSSPPAAPPK